MPLSVELAALFRRDLARLVQELKAFPEGPALWTVVPGVANSAGNLALHLEGNLREYIGRQMGQIAYTRDRPLEFSSKDIPAAELIARIESVAETIPGIVASAALETTHPENVFGSPMTTGWFVMHLFGHLNYHMGQIDYLRRVLTRDGAIEFVRV
jgi:uncharacterized damage-inducible protein DinB